MFILVVKSDFIFFFLIYDCHILALTLSSPPSVPDLRKLHLAIQDNHMQEPTPIPNHYKKQNKKMKTRE